jgi:hypothetical protein
VIVFGANPSRYVHSSLDDHIDVIGGRIIGANPARTRLENSGTCLIIITVSSFHTISVHIQAFGVLARVCSLWWI